MPGDRAEHRLLLWRALAVLALVVNLWVLYAPRVSGPEVPGIRLDWVGHALTFAALTFTALMARVPPALVLVLVTVNAAASEAIQHWFLPERTGDVTDLVADLVGVAVGWFGWRWVSRGMVSRDGERARPDPGR